MKNNNYIVGIGLIILGLAYFLRNFDISIISTLFLLTGIYFLYEYTTKKHQPHLMFGVILAITGAVMLIKDFGMLRVNLSGEMFLIALGTIFLLIYFKKGILGFVFPGFILPCIAVFIFIENNIRIGDMWPSFFILLGVAFYLIYFTAFLHKSSWPLIPGTTLILFGLVCFAFEFGLLTMEMILSLEQYKNYLLAGGITLIGGFMLVGAFKRK